MLVTPRRYVKQSEYRFVDDEVFHDRYVFAGVIGRGAFGQVFRAFDKHTNEIVAIKIFRDEQTVERHAKQEVDILTTLNMKDDPANPTTVRLLDQFMHGEHICIVMEMLSMNLYELTQSNGGCGLPLPLIRSFATQILRALRFYASPEIRLLHSDIKPENILLVNDTSAAIKIIDFGGSSFDDFKPFTYIQSRHYRSPEILLGIKYSTPIDMWSLGCVLVELLTGVPLFPGRTEREVMWEIVEVLGMPPQAFLFLSKRSTHYFERGPDMKWRHNTSKSKKTEKARPLDSIIKEAVIDFSTIHPDFPSPSPQEIIDFTSLISRMLEFEPEKRITPEQALAHPFFSNHADAEKADLDEMIASITQPHEDEDESEDENEDNDRMSPSTTEYETVSSAGSMHSQEAGHSLSHVAQSSLLEMAPASQTGALSLSVERMTQRKKSVLPFLPAVLEDSASASGFGMRRGSNLRLLTLAQSSTEREVAISRIVVSTPETPTSERFVPSPSGSHHSDDAAPCNPQGHRQSTQNADQLMRHVSTL